MGNTDEVFQNYIDRFVYVKDDIKRTNLALSTQYISFLLGQNKNKNLPLNIYILNLKTILIYCVSIIECLCEDLTKNNKKANYKNFLNQKWENEAEVKFPLPESLSNTTTRRVITHLQVERKEYLTNQTPLKKYTELLLTMGLINENHKKNIDSLCEKRNNIHLKTLNVIDNEYTDTDLATSFKVIKELLLIYAKNT